MLKKGISNLVTAGRLTLAGVAAVSGYWFLLRPRALHWGASEEETRRTLPGDELIPNPKLNVTHAVTINAPVEKVWPWLVQIGQGRGGFYSYEWIENLMGLNIHNADHILPEYQNLKAGDRIKLAPNGFAIPVAILEPNRALVLHGDTRQGGEGAPPMKPGDYFSTVWGWHLFPVNGGAASSAPATRIIERWLLDWTPSLQNSLFMHAFLEPGAFIMERKMLLGIKERAETFSLN
jgi:hypothetical protein